MKQVVLLVLFTLWTKEGLGSEQDWAQQQFRLANGPGAIGETGHLHMINQGLFVRPFYNDQAGHTDKHLSGLILDSSGSEFSWNHPSQAEPQ